MYQKPRWSYKNARKLSFFLFIQKLSEREGTVFTPCTVYTWCMWVTESDSDTPPWVRCIRTVRDELENFPNREIKFFGIICSNLVATESHPDLQKLLPTITDYLMTIGVPKLLLSSKNASSLSSLVLRLKQHRSSLCSDLTSSSASIG